MKDYIHSAIKWISYNRYTFLSTGIAAAMLSLASCTFTAKDPKTGKEMTKEELVRNLDIESKEGLSRYKKLEADFQAEIAKLEADDARIIAQYEAAIASVDRQQQVWADVMNWVYTIPVVNTNPMLGGAVGLAGAVFGLGVGIDNRRKDKVIKQAKSKSKDNVSPT